MKDSISLPRGVKYYFRYFSSDVCIIDAMLKLSKPSTVKEIIETMNRDIQWREIISGLQRMKARGIIKTTPGEKYRSSILWYVPDGLQVPLSLVIRERYAAELSELHTVSTIQPVKIQG